MAFHEALELAKDVTSILTFLVVLYGVFLGYKQLVYLRRSQCENIAKQMYARALELCAQNPQFAEPGPLSEFSPSEYVSYKWQTGYLFNACEELMAYSDAGWWENEIKQVIQLHEEWINSEEFKSFERPSLTPEFVKLIDKYS